MKQNEREALKRLIEYAKLEAEQQREDFAAYLLELARRSLDAPGRVSAAGDLRQMQ